MNNSHLSWFTHHVYENHRHILCSQEFYQFSLFWIWTWSLAGKDRMLRLCKMMKWLWKEIEIPGYNASYFPQQNRSQNVGNFWNSPPEMEIQFSFCYPASAVSVLFAKKSITTVANVVIMSFVMVYCFIQGFFFVVVIFFYITFLCIHLLWTQERSHMYEDWLSWKYLFKCWWIDSINIQILRWPTFHGTYSLISEVYFSTLVCIRCSLSSKESYYQQPCHENPPVLCLCCICVHCATGVLVLCFFLKHSLYNHSCLSDFFTILRIIIYNNKW